ncbi:hypothetical protein [Aestuariibius sp. HNIBRBA575]|uniref:hypothetical protein n=1 Tax=Aestuariibius sp. HNIBRBA575 TaxID=3233343 RepID=UPI0034A21673
MRTELHVRPTYLDHKATRLARLRSHLITRTPRYHKPNLLFVTTIAADLPAALLSKNWRDGYNKAAVWIIDAFHTSHLKPRWFQKNFDRIFVMRPNDVAPYAAATGLPVDVLPWGTDALGLGFSHGDKPIDLLRVGRQPMLFDHDYDTKVACNDKGLIFSGRPPFGSNDQSHIPNLFSHYQKAKFVLASSNLVSPAPYVHGSQEYLTARWTDALAAGAIVAGQAPHSDRAFSDLIWPEATLDIPMTDRNAALAKIRTAVDRWSYDLAKFNADCALKRLDWRLRFAQLADYFSYSTSTLDKSLKTIRSLRRSS